jgi:hypothetical protein
MIQDQSAVIGPLSCSVLRGLICSVTGWHWPIVAVKPCGLYDLNCVNYWSCSPGNGVCTSTLTWAVAVTFVVTCDWGPAGGVDDVWPVAEPLPPVVWLVFWKSHINIRHLKSLTCIRLLKLRQLQQATSPLAWFMSEMIVSCTYVYYIQILTQR